jgi:hypothetical protein
MTIYFYSIEWWMPFLLKTNRFKYLYIYIYITVKDIKPDTF